MTVVMKILAVADGSDTPLAGRYVRRWHPNPRNPGLPMVDAVSDPTGARKFPDMAAAHAYWTEVNHKHPVRPDGKPNRPMTAYTVEFIHLDQ